MAAPIIGDPLLPAASSNFCCRPAIELGCLLREGKEVRLRDLPDPIRLAAVTPGDAEATSMEAEQISVRLDRPLDEIVRQVLRTALEIEGGNRPRAARRLGISLRTIQRFVARRES